jgi:ethanolamine transporter
MGINDVATVSFLASSVSATTIFGTMEKMDRKGVVLNAAFSVSASFVFGSHLAFTMAFDSGYLAPMMVGKILSGVCAVALAMLLYKEKTDES